MAIDEFNKQQRERAFYSATLDDMMVLFREADTRTYFTTIIERSIRVLKDKDIPHKNILMPSIRALENKKDEILAFPNFIHMDDFHDNNIMTDGKRITGFIDLEMTRLGNEILFLGQVLLGCGTGIFSWKPFRKGYEEMKGKSLSQKKLSLIKIAAFFPLWSQFAWYWSINELPWWAKEGNMQLSVVNQIKKAVNEIESVKL